MNKMLLLDFHTLTITYPMTARFDPITSKIFSSVFEKRCLLSASVSSRVVNTETSRFARITTSSCSASRRALVVLLLQIIAEYAATSVVYTVESGVLDLSIVDN